MLLILILTALYLVGGAVVAVMIRRALRDIEVRVANIAEAQQEAWKEIRAREKRESHRDHERRMRESGRRYA